ncbi:GNAT family N-acetyltransferase [Gangjinia marincola]|uniref:GNAT family N-acetyltransferase n=1 Tax=Gangjinia marincola TaxID=578463 RepID=A0ABP3XQV4_9FLAO
MKSYALKNKSVLVVREPLARDAENMIAYAKTVGDETDLLTFNAADFDITLDEEIELIHRFNSDRINLCMLGIINEKIVSMLSTRTSKRPRLRHASEFGISVLKNEWNNGIARIMITEMISRLKQNGTTTKINLKVLVHNTNAIKLYTSLGFRIEGRLVNDFKLNDSYSDCYCMGLII